MHLQYRDLDDNYEDTSTMVAYLNDGAPILDKVVICYDIVFKKKKKCY